MPLVAIIEDNPDNRLLAEALLEDVYDLMVFEGGPDALAAFESRRPDVVLLDISLPGMDGIEVLKRLRADERLASLPVVALTAHAMAGDRERFIALGFDSYVSKPILDEQALIGAIDALLPRG